MKSDITSTKIQFHLTSNDFEARLSEPFDLIFLGFSLVGMLLCCGYLIASESSYNIYGLNIFLLLFSPIIWVSLSLICEIIFPFIGEFVITVDSKQLSISRRISIAVYKKSIPKEDIIAVGQSTKKVFQKKTL
jgi:hypothetical protein